MPTGNGTHLPSQEAQRQGPNPGGLAEKNANLAPQKIRLDLQHFPDTPTHDD
jgi:hypothetical protein